MIEAILILIVFILVAIGAKIVTENKQIQQESKSQQKNNQILMDDLLEGRTELYKQIEELEKYKTHSKDIETLRKQVQVLQDSVVGLKNRSK